MLQESGGWEADLPFVLPASRKHAMDLMMPKTSCVTRVMTFPRLGSGRRRVRRDPEAVMICCSLVPENWPRMACVTDEGGWIVRE